MVGWDGLDADMKHLYGWFGMKSDIELYLKTCDWCQHNKGIKIAVPLKPIVATKLRERGIYNLTDMGINPTSGYRY